jgi:hypothetical protein
MKTNEKGKRKQMEGGDGEVVVVEDKMPPKMRKR